MIREREDLLKGALTLIDLGLTAISLCLAYYLYHGNIKGIQTLEQYWLISLIMLIIWFIFLRSVNSNHLSRTQSIVGLLVNYFFVALIGTCLLFVFGYLLKLQELSRATLIIFGILNFVLLSAFKIILHVIFRKYRSKGYNTRYVIVYADCESDKFIEELINKQEWGFKIRYILTQSDAIKQKYGKEYKIMDVDTVLKPILKRETIDEVMYCIKEFSYEDLRNIVYICKLYGVVFNLKYHVLSVLAMPAQLEYYDEHPFFRFAKTPSDAIALFIKAVFDRIFSFFMLLITSPVLILVTIIIRATSKGPAIFKQKRVGLNGRIFTMYKFRTMVQNAETLRAALEKQNEMDGPVFKIKKDPRVTKIGRILRKTSLDEFPQFYNVLKGDMSVVGPRPPIPAEVDEYEDWQRRRLSMKPGITCIWQVSGRNEISFEEWMRMDLQYIDSWSVRLDIELISKTIRALFSGR